MEKKFIFAVLAFFIAAAIYSGCAKKDDFNEPTKYQSQEGLAKMTQQQSEAMKKSPAVDNPRFLRAVDLSPASQEVKDLNAGIRPVLNNIFGDAKLVSESKAPETRADGEVVENRFTYVVKQVLNNENGVALHATLHAAHFGLSPRLGSKPTAWSGGVGMSLFYNTSRRSYSIVINVDTKKQQIVVESYKLGSKYDRLL